MPASSPGSKALHPSPLPTRRKSKPLTGVFWILYIVAPVNLSFYFMSTGPVPALSSYCPESYLALSSSHAIPQGDPPT